ncbi:hypothetical protein Tco_0209623 [Tanacetum coccineum]
MKKLLDLRSRIKNHVFYSVGNGKNTSMCFDIWDIKGPLSDIIPRRVWFSDICNINVPLLSNDDTDKVMWLNNQNEKKEFSTKQAWCDLRDNVDKVEWSICTLTLTFSVVSSMDSYKLDSDL